MAVVALTAAGCTKTQTLVNRSALSYEPRDGRNRVLVLPVDVELSEVTAGGLREPNAAWTAQAKVNVDEAVEGLFGSHGFELLRYEESRTETAEAQLQALKLHETVGRTILLHKFVPEFALPTKEHKFDWSLGRDVAVFGDAYDADYAVFIHFRDSFVSSGRAAVIFFTAVLGVYLPGGIQRGFASIVDLGTGDVVWFNRLVSETGDLRDPDRARDAVRTLLADLPL